MKFTLLVVAAVFMFFSGCGSQTHDHNMNVNSHADHSKMDHSKMDHSRTGHAMESSPGATAAPRALQFIDTMIVHHQGAVDMALLAETRAADTEIKSLAKKIIADQRKEIAQMREWRSSWFSDAAPAVNIDMPGMHEGMQGMDLKKLERSTAADFDREFAIQMIPHHEGAVVMAKEMLTSEGHPELKNLAGQIINAQRAEIELMRRTLAAPGK